MRVSPLAAEAARGRIVRLKRRRQLFELHIADQLEDGIDLPRSEQPQRLRIRVAVQHVGRICEPRRHHTQVPVDDRPMKRPGDGNHHHSGSRVPLHVRVDVDRARARRARGDGDEIHRRFDRG
jgi:hypothetical protein